MVAMGRVTDRVAVLRRHRRPVVEQPEPVALDEHIDEPAEAPSSAPAYDDLAAQIIDEEPIAPYIEEIVVPDEQVAVLVPEPEVAEPVIISVPAAPAPVEAEAAPAAEAAEAGDIEAVPVETAA